MKDRIFNKYQKESSKYSELFNKLVDTTNNEDIEDLNNQLIYYRGRMDALAELYESLGE